MADFLELLLILFCFWFLIKILIPKIIDFFVKQKENKFLLEILKSDLTKKQLIETTGRKIKKKIKFGIHPLSVFYSNIYCLWGIKSGRINVPLDKSRNILPYDNDQQIFTLAHELIHLQEKDYKKKKKSCGYKLIDCMLEELETDLFTIMLLKEVGVEIGKQIFKNQKQKFWSERLKVKVDIQCEKCHQIVKQGECPELQKISECLNVLALESGLVLIADSVPSKKNGVTFYFNSFRNCFNGRVFTISFFVAQPRRAWAMPSFK